MIHSSKNTLASKNTLVSQEILPNVEIKSAFNLQSNDTQNKSYFYPLDEPRDAFASRIFLIDNAQKSIDVQYYIYKEDASGAFFTYHLLQAAKRGVKIRILIDDLDTSGKDKSWLLAAAHPNISIKVFNPIKFRKFLRFAQLALHVDSLGRRMHNKALIVDGKYAIVGGRNIGDEYYATGENTLFLDFDILCAGKITTSIVEMYEEYWNSSVVANATKILDAVITDEDYAKAQRMLSVQVDMFLSTPIALAMVQSDFVKKVKHNEVHFVEANAEFLYDHPEKIITDEKDDTHHITKKIAHEFEHIEKNVLIISPYFIPTRTMLEKFRYLRKKGVEIIIITNSLASTDVFLVYSGYQKHIKELVEMGIKLYEIKPHSFARMKTSKKWIRQNRISLHSKVMVIDERYLTVGSANLDPRSLKLNTETFLIIDSKKLCNTLLQQARNTILSDDLIEISWGRVPSVYTLDGIESYGVIYKTTENGKEMIYYKPPYSGFWKVLGTNIMSYFPIDGYL